MSEFLNGFLEFFLSIRGRAFFGIIGGTILFHIFMRKDLVVISSVILIVQCIVFYYIVGIDENSCAVQKTRSTQMMAGSAMQCWLLGFEHFGDMLSFSSDKISKNFSIFQAEVNLGSFF